MVALLNGPSGTQTLFLPEDIIFLLEKADVMGSLIISREQSQAASIWLR